jgi:hypothetical protein
LTKDWRSEAQEREDETRRLHGEHVLPVLLGADGKRSSRRAGGIAR